MANSRFGLRTRRGGVSGIIKGVVGLPSGFIFDSDALAYINAVEDADIQELEDSIKIAINDFVIGCKDDGIWDAIKASCILAGARTLLGALVPLKGSAPTSFNFVSGDYNRKTGLKGDGINKSIDTNTAHNIASQNNAHASIYASFLPTNTQGSYIYVTSGSVTGIGYDAGISGSLRSVWIIHDTGSAVPRFDDSVTGFKGVSRNSSANFIRRTGGSSTTVTRAASATAPSTGDFFVFGRATNTLYTDARMSFYSIGDSIDLALLDSRVTTLINAYDAAI
jgi:hypothetical protein